MKDFIITTENAADLPDEYVQEHNIGVLSLYYTIDGVTYGPDHETPMEADVFYEKMRGGSMPKTMQVNPEQAYRRFKDYLEQGLDVLHIALTSAVSGSYNSARMAAEELIAEFPDRTITVIDSLVGTLCEGMVVDKAVCFKKAGKTLDEISSWIQAHIPHFCLFATVDDLNHLCRGGRVSKTTAFLGSAIGIKPILKLNGEGNLVPISKVRGRKQSLNTLVDYMEKIMGRFKDENDIVYISHGDCIEDAKYVAKLVEDRFGIKKSLISYIGPVIGSHAGPGAVALSFLGSEK